MASSNTSAHTSRRSKESERIGSFQRQEEIGRGSFATVYKAIHTVRETEKTPCSNTTDMELSGGRYGRLTLKQSPQGISTVVAIKSVNLGKLNKKLKENLTSEISILKGLHHPHIVALIDCKDTSSHIHLVMEYVALGDLSYFIKKRDMIKDSELVGNMMEKYPNPRNGGLHEVVVRHFLQQLSSALQFLRVRNLIHRDVKPQNLLLNPSPEYFESHSPAIMPYCASDDALYPVCGVRSLPMLKIADFGFARSLPSTSLAETLCGSPLYMAPEILRYEKYDAKADLWSVGTVLYEMVTSKPPFRAANHVELLRRIEKGEDRIKFGDDIVVSDPLKKLIRSLLKRDPKERLNFPDFFSNEIITGPIPGLAPEDLPAQPQSSPRRDADRRRGSRADSNETMTRPGRIQEPESPYLDQQQAMGAEVQEGRRPSGPVHRRISSLAAQAPLLQPPSEDSRSPSRRKASIDGPASPTGLGARPGLTTHATAPGRQELHHRNPPPASTAMERQTSSGKSQKTPSLLRDQVQEHQRAKELRRHEGSERDRAAQDIADEREYVLIEKRAVEVNALADELEASPRLTKLQSSPQAATMRRAISQGTPGSTTGVQTSASRAVQIASGRRPDILHNRQNSYERRYGPSPSSATSAISKALNMASGRLWGFSPPVNLRPGGRSPPVGYSPFPVYPGAQSSLVVVGDNKQPTSIDEDTKFVQNVEEIATRSDVVYGFAEVKWKQLTPATPSAPNNGLGLRNTEAGDVNDDLTIEAIVTVAEEALVLYVKALSLLAKAMDIAAKWWARKSREGVDTSQRGNNTTFAAGQRMNNVVQWIRGRFNEVLEKADLVRMKLLENQKRLPEDHPSHPNNISAGTTSSTGMGTSADHVVVSSGVTAEKLMYDRALEMSRSAAINELTGEDLQGCEISYVTSIRMLEAVLETDDDLASRKGSSTSDQEKQDQNDDDAPIIGLEAEDRKAVKACEYFIQSSQTNTDIVLVVQSIIARLKALRKKLQVIQKRASAPAIGSPTRASPPITHRTSNPMIAGVSAR